LAPICGHSLAWAVNIKRVLRVPYRLTCWCFCALLLATAAAPAWAARLAMVVGNDSYAHASRLRNARNDARSLTAELQAAGFKVTQLLDAKREVFNEELDGFLRRIQKGDEVVFFFAGHGSQPPSVGPHLLPVDIRITSERSVARDGQSLERLVDDLNQRARFSLVIIDACRDDPYRQTLAGRSNSEGSGLGRIEPPKGTMIIMSASRGQQALDRLNEADTVANGLFTRELLRQMREAGLSAAEMLKRVRGNVELAAAAVNHQQRPSLVDESSSDFFFYPASGPRLAAVELAAPAGSAASAGSGTGSSLVAAALAATPPSAAGGRA
jgi:uncharacterized caspase-like protein